MLEMQTLCSSIFSGKNHKVLTIPCVLLWPTLFLYTLSSAEMLPVEWSADHWGLATSFGALLQALPHYIRAISLRQVRRKEMSTICDCNKEKKRNTHPRVKEASWNIAPLLSYLKSAESPPLSGVLFWRPDLASWWLNLAFSPRVRVAKSRRHAGGGGGLGSPLAGFSPNTGINFLTISLKLLDIWPVFLLIFSPIKTALLLILF